MSQDNPIVPVVFICDENYALPTAVAITSLKLNRIEAQHYAIYVLGVGLSEDSKKKIYSLNDTNFSVSVKDSELSDIQKKVRIYRERVTLAALLKFDLPVIFSEYDKLLYIDSDVVIQKDLAELFKIPLTDEYAAVVKDTMTVQGRQGHLKKLDFKPEAYFNSGVLLLNLKKMREDDIPEKLLEYRISGYNQFMDQDALNVVFDGKVKYISPYYNCLNCFFEWQTIDELSDFYSEKFPPVKELVYRQATVLHFGDKKKPWLYSMKYLTDLYRAYYAASPYADRPFLPDSIESPRIEELSKELAEIKKSKSFRIGRGITWLPRRLRGGVRCYREHGVGYTVRRALYHMGFREDQE